ncbi:pyrimidine (deoxy)nucleoside triphosphate pyrophosphohydrolase [Yersinia rohdei]|uniref:pyrimidine (deoxy)nucleoside triphosphate diphosphatase n=1 Tax=Yersinia rohdei TaxID=29485 RepID=UPI00061C5EB2|nr:pyrimidine (deoxy)nucleoside triphosphate diphosphatase [Yersinia rohdei]CND99606.1 pyrimidine (deoxy)nucleoside triphosphate pyrophosphohydrolase [Yersinia rohdei]
MIDVVAAIIEKNGKILLAQRDSHRDQAGLWEFPGGKVEVGENQLQALIRELAEELAIEVSVAKYIATNQWVLSKNSIQLHAWHIESFSGEPILHCHSSLAWLAPEEAYRYPLAPADIPLLEAFIAQKRQATI